MSLKKALATVLWINLAMVTSARALPDCPKHVCVGSTSIVEKTSRQADASAADSPVRPDFSGDWALNTDASDDPREKARDAMRASRPSRGGGTGGMGRGGGKSGGTGRGGMGGRAQGYQGMDRMYGSGSLSSSELSTLFAPAQELHIKHQEPLLQVTYENDQHERIFTDFRGGSISTNGGMQQRVSVAGWEGSVLVVETTMLDKKLTQSYQLDEETGQLVISTIAQVSVAQPVTYRLVYDQQKPLAEGARIFEETNLSRGETR